MWYKFDTQKYFIHQWPRLYYIVYKQWQNLSIKKNLNPSLKIANTDLIVFRERRRKWKNWATIRKLMSTGLGFQGIFNLFSNQMTAIKRVFFPKFIRLPKISQFGSERAKLTKLIVGKFPLSPRVRTRIMWQTVTVMIEKIKLSLCLFRWKIVSYSISIEGDGNNGPFSFRFTSWFLMNGRNLTWVSWKRGRDVLTCVTSRSPSKLVTANHVCVISLVEPAFCYLCWEGTRG